MRKSQKSVIYDCFQSVNIETDNGKATYIIDEVYLLHRVRGTEMKPLMLFLINQFSLYKDILVVTLI